MVLSWPGGRRGHGRQAAGNWAAHGQGGKGVGGAPGICRDPPAVVPFLIDGCFGAQHAGAVLQNASDFTPTIAGLPASPPLWLLPRPPRPERSDVQSESPADLPPGSRRPAQSLQYNPPPAGQPPWHLPAVHQPAAVSCPPPSLSSSPNQNISLINPTALVFTPHMFTRDDPAGVGWLLAAGRPSVLRLMLMAGRRGGGGSAPWPCQLEGQAPNCGGLLLPNSGADSSRALKGRGVKGAANGDGALATGWLPAHPTAP